MAENYDVEMIVEPAFVSAVKESLYKSKYAGLVAELRCGMLKDYPVFLFGGAVRNPLIKVIHEEERQPADYDILVDDRPKPIDFNQFFNDEFDLEYNRFGNLKIRNDFGVSVDVIPFTKKKLYVDGNRGEEPNLENLLRSADFVMSAIAFDLDASIIYSYGAYYDILERKINNLRVTDAPHVVLSRLVLYEKKLKFEIGKSTQEFIANNYSQGMNERIWHYLEYKEQSKEYFYVTFRLGEISAQNKR